MAGRRENTQLIFTRCIKCDTSVAAIVEPTKRLVHLEDGNHTWVDWNPAGEKPTHRPEWSTVAMWKDLRAALNNIHQVEFYCGFLPEKPSGMTQWEIAEVVRLQLDDARRVLGQLADALADGAAS